MIFHSIRFYLKMNNIFSRSCSSSYEEAIQKLNSLQSNKAAIEKMRKEIAQGNTACTNIEKMEHYLARAGVSLSMLDQLSVVHVAGTKGKGSTSAMCESILRHHGFRTGFYSSPHLVAVRERIRLDGRMISKDKFANAFHRVYDMLEATQGPDLNMPQYFGFLTILAFKIFIEEKVDVAIIEVGIGGIVDYTNVLRKVPIVGITALGFDHTAILGYTLPEIAAAKAGVMKPGCEAYTVKQPPEAMEVLERVAAQVECTLKVAPEYKCYGLPKCEKESPYNLESYQTNASLAIQLAHAWMSLKNTRNKDQVNMINGLKTSNRILKVNGLIKEMDTNGNNDESRLQLSLPEKTSLALKKCIWPGRYQIIKTSYAHFYLDGAHTRESMEICAEWFQNNSRFHNKILIFSVTGNRNAMVLLDPLRKIGFKETHFVIPRAYKKVNSKNDNYSIYDPKEIAVCRSNAESWRFQLDDSTHEVEVLDSVSESLNRIKHRNNVNTSVLITGSLHLVGAALSILDPNLCEE